MKELINNNVFPYDVDTLSLIKEAEDYLGLENKEINKLCNIELRDYIEEIAEALLQKKVKIHKNRH
jgi:hypothetical protein